jgi:O-antigen/teichoic acid export membrane protein
MTNARRKVLLAVLGNLGPPAAAFITAPILAQSLGVFERGQVAAGGAPLMLVASAATLGMPEAVTYFVARSGGAGVKRTVGIAAGLVTAAGVIATVLFIALAPLLSGGDADVQSLILISLSMVVPSLILLVLRGVSAGRGRWGLITWERMVGSVARLVAVAALALTGTLTILSATVAISVSTAVGIVVYIALLRPKRLPAEHPPRTADLLGYGTRVWFGSLAGILLSRIAQILVVPLSNATELGLFVIAVAIAELVLVFNNAVRDVYFAEESRDPDMHRVAGAARTSTLITVALAVAVGLASIWGIPLLFGPEFEPAVLPTWLLLAAIVLGNPGSLAGAGLSAMGRPHLRSWSLLVALVANLVTLFLLAPVLGAIGAALATAVGNVIAAGLNLVWMRRVSGNVGPADFLVFRRQDFRDIISVVRGIMRRR